MNKNAFVMGYMEKSADGHANAVMEQLSPMLDPIVLPTGIGQMTAAFTKGRTPKEIKEQDREGEFLRLIKGAGGRGRMGGPLAAGPSGNCVCPGCGLKVPHIPGHPCTQRVCPKCGTRMIRE